MRVEAIDERDGRNEGEASLFRVTIFRGGDDPMCSWATATYEVSDADVLEVVDWARTEAALDGLFAVALVVDHAGPQGDREEAVWLVGTDANIGEPDEQQRRWFDAMLERRAQYRQQHAAPEQDR